MGIRAWMGMMYNDEPLGYYCQRRSYSIIDPNEQDISLEYIWYDFSRMIVNCAPANLPAYSRKPQLFSAYLGLESVAGYQLDVIFDLVRTKTKYLTKSYTADLVPTTSLELMSLLEYKGEDELLLTYRLLLQHDNDVEFLATVNRMLAVTQQAARYRDRIYTKSKLVKKNET